MIKIIYIAGDGRSGSTLLDAILSNIKDSISVGECHRFWVRFYEKETLCGCRKKIEDCELWSQIDTQLKIKFSEYNQDVFKQQVKEIQYYKNFKRIPKLIKSKKWQLFSEVVKTFYGLIASITGKDIIIDSSKSMSWAYLLYHLDFCDFRVIHLERNLVAVANSWKKDVILPEYHSKRVMMPKKTNILILKSWFKIKILARFLRKSSNYLYVSYEKLCENPKRCLLTIQTSIEESFEISSLNYNCNHAIGGNPMRIKIRNEIVITRKKEKLVQLNRIEKLFFIISNWFAKVFIR